MKATVATSWDDGNILYLNVAGFLQKYNLIGFSDSLLSREKIEPTKQIGSSRKIKRKLLIVTPYFLPKVGGLERYAFEMANRASCYYDVSVVTSGKSKKIEFEIMNGIRVYRLPVQFKLANTPLNITWYSMIKKILRKEKPDVLNIHMPVPGLPDIACLAVKDVPIIVTYHAGSMKKGSFFIDRLILIYERFLLPNILKRANKIICSSEAVRFDFLGKYKYKSETINPGVDTKIFYKRKAIPDGRNVLFVGNFNNDWKGLKYLTEAMKEVPDTTLNIVGKGKIIEQPNVVYHGELKDEDLVRQLHKSRVLVLPSISSAESFGMVLIEAMACGVPVIGSNIGGIPTVINDKVDGLIVEPKDSSGLAQAISFILDNQEKAENISNSAYQKVNMNYKWDILAEKYIKIISNLFEDKKFSHIEDNT